jgi:dUTP pyrophosphatase
MKRLKLLDEELYAEDVKHSIFRPKFEADAGLDLRARTTTKVHAGETKVIPLGIAVEIPFGRVGWLTGRSSTAIDRGLFVHEGKIDAGYRGEINCFVTAQGAPVTVERGDRLCQLVTVVIESPTWESVIELTHTDRGEQGLGSSGRR